MLETLRRGVGRVTFTLGMAAVLALSSTGCASGEHDTTFSFLVAPLPAGTFLGWTDITLGVDVQSVGFAELYGVTIQAQDPTASADLSFLSSLTGAAVNPDSPGTSTTLVSLSDFPRGETTADLHIDYLGDMRPMFDSTNTIRINWTGEVNPAFTGWPAGGIWVSGDVTINVE